jgi:4,5-dihydroxyphthalate decarboxylase
MSSIHRVEVSVALTRNDRTRALLEGEAGAEGLHLLPSALAPGEMFWRQLKYGDFDVSEMSLSSLMIAASHGVRDWVALPVFTWREFFHTTIRVRADSGIRVPADLIGRRVGVKEYQQTAALWTRGIMQHAFGVLPTDVEWFMERTAARSHGGSTAFRPPEGLRFSYIAPEKNLGAMLLAGEIDALYFYLPANNVLDRSITLEGNQAVRPLFPDPLAEGVRYYRETGIYPINHCVVVRRSLVEKHPWIPLNLYAAFTASKEVGRRRVAEGILPFLEAGTVDASAREALARDPMPYGVQSNARVLSTIAAYQHEQGLVSRAVELDEVFWPSTLSL